LLGHQLVHLAQQTRRRKRHSLRLHGSRETQKVARDFLQPVNLPADELGVRAFARGRCERLLLSEKAGLDCSERIADFVRDTRCEHAERGELFVPLDQRLTFALSFRKVEIGIRGAIHDR
jgi:hypothetical protein